MQIHELELFTGTPPEGTYIAIDDGTETMKTLINDVGVTTEMTVEEANIGTSEEPRVITPAVLSSYTESNYVDIDTGNINLDTSAQSGDDYNLTQILTTLGWLNDVIV